MLRWKELCSDLSIPLQVYSPLILIGLPCFLLWSKGGGHTDLHTLFPRADCRTGATVMTEKNKDKIEVFHQSKFIQCIKGLLHLASLPTFMLFLVLKHLFHFMK